MVDYISSFNVGIKNAEVAERNRQEISEVFDELNRQLSLITKDKVEIKPGEVTQRLHNPLLAGLSSIDILSPPTRYSALLAKHKTNTRLKPQELARWSQPTDGYPCKLKQGDREIICEDKEALEKALEFLLTTPEVGASLYKLINHVEQSSPPDTN